MHRLNQTVDVTVYKLTVAKTVESRIFDLQEKKRALAEAAIEGKAVAKLSMDDLLDLFKHDGHGDESAGSELVPKPSALLAGVSPLPAAPVAGLRATSDSRSTSGQGSRPRHVEHPVFGRRW